MNGNETTELKALTKNEVMVTFKGLVINRVPCCGYIRFDVADDGVTVALQGKTWDHRIRRPNEYKDEVPPATKKAALEHAQKLVEAYVRSPDGAYALLHAEVKHREYAFSAAHAELRKAEEAMADAKAAIKKAKSELAAASKARTALWNKQHPNYAAETRERWEKDNPQFAKVGS